MSIISLNKVGGNFGAGSGPLAVRIQESLHSGNYSTESADAIKFLGDNSFESRVDLSAIADNLKGILEPNNKEANFANPNGMKAAAFLATFAQNPSALLNVQISNESAALGTNVRYAHADGLEFDTQYSKESFDNQSLIDHLPISIGLNYKIARQGPAMEMVYRTIPLTPEQGGFDITIPNLFVQNTLRHSQDGKESDFGLRRVMDSALDYTVLHDNSTQLIPGYTDVAKENFVAESVVTPFDYTHGRRTVLTSALLVNKTMNLFGLGQSDSISRVGQADYTEALDRNIGIADVYLSLGADTLVFDTKGLPFSRYTKQPEQGGRMMALNFPLTSMIIDKNSTTYDGKPLTGAVFTTIADGEYSVRLKTRLNGNSDVERGSIDVSTTSLEVMYIQNKAGEKINLASGVGKTIVDGLAQLKVVAWWPDARLTNTNHRHLGLMLNVRNVTERLLTRQRAPFFVPYPLGENRDQTIMDWLTFAVSTYINNEAVGTLIGYHERLMRLTGGLRGEMTVDDFEINALPIEGIGRYLINPYVQTVTVNLLETAQSQETVANVENGIAVLVNTLRSLAFDILQRTNYENACRYMDGGEVAQPFRFGLVTSKQIERFLTISGDARTLGAGLKYQLEADVDERLRDSMYLVIIRDGEGVDPLTSGAMLLTPTLVSTISVTRDGRPVNEAVVQPRFQHYNFCPIIVKLNVLGVTELLEQTLPFRVSLVESEAGNGGTDPGTGGGSGGAGGVGGDDTGAGTGDETP